MTLHQVMAESFGKGDSEGQAELLNAMAHQLVIACHTGDRHDLQICRMSNLLDSYGKNFIRKLYEYVESK